MLLTEPQPKKKKKINTCDLLNDKAYSQEIFHQNKPFICPFLMALAASSGKTFAAFQASIKKGKICKFSTRHMKPDSFQKANFRTT